MKQSFYVTRVKEIPARSDSTRITTAKINSQSGVNITFKGFKNTKVPWMISKTVAGWISINEYEEWWATAADVD